MVCEKSKQQVFDRDVAKEEWYGCSDGTTTGYLKVRTEQIVMKQANIIKRKLLPIQMLGAVLVIGGSVFAEGVVIGKK